jgi:hypothetical protein
MDEKHKEIAEFLKGYDSIEVKKFITYCKDSETALTSDKKKKFPFWQYLTAETLADHFKNVKAQGLVLDGVHITIQSTGVTYDYIARRNKLLLSFPETVLDVQLFYQGDNFSVKNESGKYIYTHEIGNVFSRKETEILGGYCFIKNQRGEFFTSLTLEELEKHRKTAKTDYIWKNWLTEMYLKTVIKKAVSVHFDDVFNDIEKEDNKSYQIEEPETDYNKEIENCKSVDDLANIWKSLSENQQSELKLIVNAKKKELMTKLEIA